VITCVHSTTDAAAGASAMIGKFPLGRCFQCLPRAPDFTLSRDCLIRSWWREPDPNKRWFSALPVVLPAIFRQSPMNLGASPFDFLRIPARNAPTLAWRPMNHPGRGRPKKPRFSAGFLGIFRKYRTSLDIAGSLWSWDGWPLNSQSKYLFSRLRRSCLCTHAPKHESIARHEAVMPTTLACSPATRHARREGI
jgi:hypothetical protein